VTHEIGIVVVDCTDERVTHGSPANRIDQRGGIMLKKLIFEHNDVARIQLMTEYWRGFYVAIIRYVRWGIKVCFGTFADPVNYINNYELFFVMMWFCHDISKSTEEVYAECAVRLPSIRRHQPKKCLNEIPGLGVVQKFDASMLSFARDARTVRNRDCIVSPQGEAVVLPLVTDNIPGSLAVRWPVALVVPERPLVEVRLTEIRSELPWKPDQLVVGQRIALAAQCGPDILVAVQYGLCCVIAHSGTRSV
jgi:hypothetical protein